MKAGYSLLRTFAVLAVLWGSSGAATNGQTATAPATNQIATASPATAGEKSWSVRSSSAAEIVRLKEANVGPEVIRAYVNNLHVPYKASAEDILFLHAHDVPDELTCRWIQRGGELMTAAAQQAPARSPDLVAMANAQNAQASGAQYAQSPVVQTPPSVVYQSAPAQVVTTPTVIYDSPTYAYSSPYWYAPPLYLGFSWGWNRPYWGGYWGGYGRSHGWGGHGYYGGPIRAGFSWHGGGGFGGHHFSGGGSHFGGGGFAGHSGGSHFGGGGFGGGHFGGGGGHHGR